jgi:hypothetical protein
MSQRAQWKYGLPRWRALWWTDPRGSGERPGLGLSSKIFLASALVIGVLAGVSALSLGAVGRLVSVNREFTTHTIPALAVTASARDAIPPLLRLEARALVLGDRHYAKAWTELAERVADDLARLAEYPLSGPEAMHRQEASAAFEEYRHIVAEEQALLQRSDRVSALRLGGRRREDAR